MVISMNSFTNTLALRLSLLATLGFSIGCAPEEDETVKVGLITSLQGGLAGFGGYLANAAILAVREVNASGGLHAESKRVELIILDDASNATRAVAAARQLIEEDEVVAIVGPIGSGPTMQVADLTLAAQIPQVTCCATSSLLTDRPETDRYLFRTAASDTLQARVLTNIILGIDGITELPACTSPEIIYINNDYGLPLANALQADLNTRGLSTEASIIEESQSSYASTVEAVLARSPDCIVLISYAGEAAVVLRDAVELSMMLPESLRWIGTDGIKATDLATMVGVTELPFIVQGTAPSTPATNPQGDAFVASFLATFGGLDESGTTYAPPGSFADSQYDAMAMTLLAIEIAGSGDGPAIRDSLLSIRAEDGVQQSLVAPTALAEGLAEIRAGQRIDYIGAAGDIDFDARGDVYGPFEVWRYNSAEETFTTLTTFSASELLGSGSQ
jgi:ABC-type branched-subunit amino acid transport system substrate-binding protein